MRELTHGIGRVAAVIRGPWLEERRGFLDFVAMGWASEPEPIEEKDPRWAS